ncbi:hypothetical protein HDU85_005780 [Gaertneriomyces sp. JEL0708]|nr:hypothetical protein HDU85_005780 [Gaertneriomyces sp. JEL0708]
MKASLAFLALIAATVSAAPAVPNDGQAHCIGECQKADPNALMSKLMQHKVAAWEQCETSTSLVCARQQNLAFAAPTPLGFTKCVDGFAGEYPCKGLDLLSFVPHTDLGSGAGFGNDIWGWTDPVTGAEIALVGQTDGTAFVDVTKPSEPKYLGRVNTNVPELPRLSWRDVKVYKDHAYIVADDARSNKHALQVFDLTQLRNVSTPQVFQPTTMYKEFGSCHNIAINEDTGFAYCVGSRTCKSGLHIVDIREPASPKFAGCADDDGYVHDAQIVIYNGPDTRFQGKEIAFAYNEDTLTIWDVTDKSKIVRLSRTPYVGSAYTHQGWLTEDHAYLLLDDELDELEKVNDGHTQTYIWDARDLTAPKYIDSYRSPVLSIDHNLYIKGNLSYQSNYGSGLRVNDVKDIANGKLTEVAYFDVAPERDIVEFEGTWSNYPYFKSGNILVNSIERGLFVVKHAEAEPAPPKPTPPKCVA